MNGAGTPDVQPAASLARGAFACGLAGLAVTVLELAAARALAPHFGQSVHVWAAVIGVMLGALALGSALGARWAEAGGAPRKPLRALLLGVGWLAVARGLAPSVCEALVPSGLPAPGGLPIGLLGSIAATLVLYALPVGVLGVGSPWLVRAVDASRQSGRGAGFLYAAGTLGSLLGCALTPLVLLQVLGTLHTLDLALALCLCTALSLWGVHLPGPDAGPGAPPARAGPAGAGAAGPARAPLALAFLAGFVTLAAELVAVRLFCPWFGQSNRIWANTIGVILFALALGAWWGERLARARAPRPALGAVLGRAGLALLPAVLLGPALCEVLAPRGIDSMRILPVAFAGSLAATLLLFGLPTLLLGAVAPLVVHLLAPVLGTGRAAGRTSAVGTLGALAGTFAGPLLLVPGLGSRLALVALAGALLLGAAWALSTRARRVGCALGGLLALALALLAPRLVVRTHPGQLVEVESAYQTVRAVHESIGVLEPSGAPSEGGQEGEAEAVFLRHDEDAETYQSAWLPRDGERVLTGGRYYEQMALGARLALPAASDGTLRVLLIGYAGGGVHRALRVALPEPVRLEVVGIEIDPAVVDVARQHLALDRLEGPGLRLVTGEDARTVVNALPADERFDLVLVDAYARTNYIPFQLATQEFFGRVRQHLAPGGWLGVNVLGTGMQGPVCRAVAAPLDRAVGPTTLHPNLWFPGNVILWSSPEGRVPEVHEARAAGTGAARWPLHPMLEVAAFALERFGVRHVPETDGSLVLTDDLSPSDLLADREMGL
ncbi:MAG: fused MFS/spermidine synthase [Planctomycetia bacterium]